MPHYYHLALEVGDTLDEDGAPVTWAACPDLPGAYEEATTAVEARALLLVLARQIIAEHVVRDDALEPEIVITAHPPTTDPGDMLIVPITDTDLDLARATPMLEIEAPEP